MMILFIMMKEVMFINQSQNKKAEKAIKIIQKKKIKLKKI